MTDGEQGVRISLSAVVIALRDRQACVLTTGSENGTAALPSGPFDPVRDRTFELALRTFVTAQTGFGLGFVEQLYTFGDAGRDSPQATPGPDRRREISIGYLALTAEAAEAPAADARWSPVLDFFPWEDRRDGSQAAGAPITDGLRAWAGPDTARQTRIDNLFALGPNPRWNEGQVLERYELLYEAGLVPESARDHGRPAVPVVAGQPMASDHRRILATGLGRLRSKLKYRPVLFDLMPDRFTLSELQAAAEAIACLSLHKQNFRRGVERTGLVEATGQLSTGTGGRPAELFRRARGEPHGTEAMGLPLPAQR